MRIAIYHNLPSGGAKRSLFEWMRRLTKTHSVDLYTLTSADETFCDTRPFARNVYIYPFQPLPLFRRPFGRLNQLYRIADFYRLGSIERYIADEMSKREYDIVFVHHCQYNQSPSVIHHLKLPSVYFCQEPPRWIIEPGIPRAYLQSSKVGRVLNYVDPLPRLYRWSLHIRDLRNVIAASYVLVNSYFSAESVYRRYGQRPQVCYLGVDTEEFKPDKLNYSDPYAVVSVGALNPSKGFDFIIRALAYLPDELRPPLIIISNTDYVHEHGYLTDLAASGGVELDIRTQVTETEISQLYNRAIFLAYAPILEPLGLAALEAMACGLPVVGVREGGVRETVVDGVTGILTDRDEEKYAGAILRMLSNPDLRKEFGAAARKHVVRNWTWESSTRQLELMLERAANKRTSIESEPAQADGPG